MDHAGDGDGPQHWLGRCRRNKSGVKTATAQQRRAGRVSSSQLVNFPNLLVTHSHHQDTFSQLTIFAYFIYFVYYFDAFVSSRYKKEHSQIFIFCSSAVLF